MCKWAKASNYVRASNFQTTVPCAAQTSSKLLQPPPWPIACCQLPPPPPFPLQSPVVGLLVLSGPALRGNLTLPPLCGGDAEFRQRRVACLLLQPDRLHRHRNNSFTSMTQPLFPLLSFDILHNIVTTNATIRLCDRRRARGGGGGGG